MQESQKKVTCLISPAVKPNIPRVRTVCFYFALQTQLVSALILTPSVCTQAKYSALCKLQGTYRHTITQSESSLVYKALFMKQSSQRQLSEN
jgi:hypothetical protein